MCQVKCLYSFPLKMIKISMITYPIDSLYATSGFQSAACETK